MFLKLLNLSAGANLIVLVVLLLRFVFRSVSKRHVCCLWVLVALRLMLPFSVESPLGLMPSTEPIWQDMIYEVEPQEGGTASEDQAFVPMHSDARRSVRPWFSILSWIWCSGAVSMAVYTVARLLQLKYRLAEAVQIQQGIKWSRAVSTPFIFGLLHPVIYLPPGISGDNLLCVLAHENAHIRRRDHWWKALGYILLTIYCFDPLLWVAFSAFCKDIEFACDEEAVKGAGPDWRKAYSITILEFSVSHVPEYPLSFSGTDVKERISRVINYKLPQRGQPLLMAGIAIFLCLLCSTGMQKAEVAMKYPEYASLDTSEGITVAVWQMSPKGYRCALFAGMQDNLSTEELINLRAVPVADVADLLAQYGIPDSKIVIRPFHALFSSYTYRIDETYRVELAVLFEGRYVVGNTLKLRT